jgi:hypothetical protein
MKKILLKIMEESKKISIEHIRNLLRGSGGKRTELNPNNQVPITPTPVADNKPKNNTENSKPPVEIVEVPYISKKQITRDVLEYFEMLSNNNSSSKDCALPFNVNLPNDINLISLSEAKKYEVLNLYPDGTIERIKKEYDIVTIIPFRGRKWHLEKTLETLMKAAKKVKSKIGFVVIENASSPTAEEMVKKFKGVEYRWLNSWDKIFNKCICHNVGTAISSSKFLHFHDCDLIVPENFYKIMEDSLSKSRAVQCFTSRRVNYLNEEATKDFFAGLDIDKIVSDEKSFNVGLYGAPGGSIAVERDLYLEVGGFDSHFFWAYSIEDNFFWKKLERKTSVLSMDNPKVELYHLWHPPGWGKNPLERFEQRIFVAFNQTHDPNQYFEKARQIYQETVNKIIKQ